MAPNFKITMTIQDFPYASPSARKRADLKMLGAELAKSELFQDAPECLLDFVTEQSIPRTLVRGEILLSPQRENHYVYVLLSGTLSLHFEAPDSPEIRELPAGVSVGEMSLIDETPPSAYVIAKEACRVLPIHRALLFSLVSDANVVTRNLLRLLTQWIKANTHQIVQNRRQIRELADCATMDSLTGLYNRRWLDNAFPRMLAQQVEEDGPLSILIIDIDRFKIYNDSQGHRAGDLALIALSEVLRETVRPGDSTIRYGGDEIVVLLQNTAEKEGLAIAERIRRSVETKSVSRSDGNPLAGITVSIGLATNNSESTPESLISEADRNLYRAKAEGRNRICH